MTTRPSRLSDITYAAAEEKAEFCLGYDVAPSEYDRLTLAEISAFNRVAARNQTT